MFTNAYRLQKLLLVASVALVAVCTAATGRSEGTPVYSTFDKVVAQVATKTTGTTVTGAFTSSVAVGKHLIVACCSRPTSITSGATNEHSISDSKGNSYNKLIEYSNGAGITVSLWKSKVTSAITTSDTFTLTDAVTAGSRGFSMVQYTLGAGQTFSLIGSSGAYASTGDHSVTLSSMPNSNHLWVGFVGWGYSTPGDGDFTDQHGFLTGANPLDSNIVCFAGHEYYTGTMKTYSGIIDIDCKWASVLVALDIVSE